MKYKITNATNACMLYKILGRGFFPIVTKHVFHAYGWRDQQKTHKTALAFMHRAVFDLELSELFICIKGPGFFQ